MDERNDITDFIEQVDAMQQLAHAPAQLQSSPVALAKAKKAAFAKLDFAKWAALGVAVIEAAKVFAKYAFKKGEWRKPHWLAFAFVAAIFKAFMAIIKIIGNPTKQ